MYSVRSLVSEVCCVVAGCLAGGAGDGHEQRVRTPFGRSWLHGQRAERVQQPWRPLPALCSWHPAGKETWERGLQSLGMGARLSILQTDAPPTCRPSRASSQSFVNTRHKASSVMRSTEGLPRILALTRLHPKQRDYFVLGRVRSLPEIERWRGLDPAARGMTANPFIAFIISNRSRPLMLNWIRLPKSCPQLLFWLLIAP
eukprot:g56542.t1